MRLHSYAVRYCSALLHYCIAVQGQFTVSRTATLLFTTGRRYHSCISSKRNICFAVCSFLLRRRSAQESAKGLSSRELKFPTNCSLERESTESLGCRLRQRIPRRWVPVLICFVIVLRLWVVPQVCDHALPLRKRNTRSYASTWLSATLHFRDEA